MEMDRFMINENTRISELIKLNKDSIEAIASLSKPLEKLKNPLLRKLMASRVTIKEAAAMGGCSVTDFEKALRSLGFAMKSQQTESPTAETTPEWLAALPDGAIDLFDVRQILADGEDPLKEILKRFKSVPLNEALCIVNTFVPVPLIRLLKKDGTLTFSKTIGPNEYHTYFYKAEKDAYKVETDATPASGSQQGAEEGSAEKVRMVSGLEFDAIQSRFEQIKEIDVRDLQMPGPMETILAVLPDLEPNEVLYVHHKRVPLYLLEEIADENYQVNILNRGEGDVKLLIFRL